MKNVTITLEEQVAQWAKIWAAKHNSSVSKLVGEMLRQRMHEEQRYEAAMKQYLSAGLKILKQTDNYPARAQLHER